MTTPAKPKETPIKLSQAIERAGKVWAWGTSGVIRKAIREKQIAEHGRTGNAKNSHIYVLWSEVKAYLESLQTN